MNFSEQELKSTFIAQSKTCGATSLLYHDICLASSDNTSICTFLSELSTKRTFSRSYELILLFLAFFNFTNINEPDFKELKVFFKTQKGNYTKELYESLEETLGKVFNEKKEALEKWLLTEKLQTNEIGRCSVIYPAIKSLGLKKINLIDLGCSAGLMLLMDLYSYGFQDEKNSFKIIKQEPLLKTATSTLNKLELLLKSELEIVSRIGIDLNPMDLEIKENISRLKCAIWDDLERTERLSASIKLFLESKESLKIKLFSADYTENLFNLIHNELDNDSPLVFFSSVSTYQIPEPSYLKLLKNLEALALKLQRKVFFIEYDDVRKTQEKIISTHENFHITIHEFPENNISQFAKAHYHGKAISIL